MSVVFKAVFLDTVLPCPEEDYNTVVETSAIKELLLNFGLELKKLRNVAIYTPIDEYTARLLAESL